MKIIVNDQVHLSEFRSSDKNALIEHLNDQDIYDRTLRLPFPYTDIAADNGSSWSPRSPSSRVVRCIGPFVAPMTP